MKSNNKKEKKRLLTRIDSDGVRATKNDAQKLIDKVNELLILSNQFGTVNIESVANIVPSINKILDRIINIYPK